jgi:CysZ protein
MKNFFAGVKFLGLGLGRVIRRPKLLLLGIIPGMLSLLLFIGLFVLLFNFLTEISRAATWFADDWSAGLRQTVEVAAGVAIVGASGLLAIITFTAVTLLIGDPFYEAIAESVEDELGGVPDEVKLTVWASLRRSVADSLRLVMLTLLVGIPLFFLGLIPVIGQTVVPVIGAFVGGWFLAVEIVGIPFHRRGLRLPDRRRMLKQNRATALGFGVAVFCCFLIPLGAVMVMPAAVAGGSLLTRHLFGQPTSLPPE